MKIMFIFIVQGPQCSREVEANDSKPQTVTDIEIHSEKLCVIAKNLNYKFKEILVQNCKSSKDISSYVAMFPSTESANSKKVLLLRFEALTDYLQLSQIEIQNLNKTYTGRDVVVTLDGKETKKSSIYWRGRGFKDFAMLKPFCGVSTEEQQKIYQYIVDFFIQCLSNGQSGMKNCATIG